MEFALEGNKLTLAAAAATAATTAVNGATLDMTGYDSVVLHATIATANAGNFIKAQQGDASDGSDMADLEGSKVVADANGSVVAIEIKKPTKRYVRGVLIRAGASTASGDMYAWRSNSASKPVTNNVTNTHKVLSLSSPAEGTP